MFELTREVPDTQYAERYDGEPMVQSFLVGDLGRVWITTADAMRVPGFGRHWILGRLAAFDDDELRSRLAGGLRLYADELVPV